MEGKMKKRIVATLVLVILLLSVSTNAFESVEEGLTAIAEAFKTLRFYPKYQVIIGSEVLVLNTDTGEISHRTWDMIKEKR